MPYSQFIKYICVGEAQIGNGKIAEHQSFVHGFVNKATSLFFIRSYGFKPGKKNGWLYKTAVYGVKIYLDRDLAVRRLSSSAKSSGLSKARYTDANLT